jgi:homoserine dehydrogenase
MKAFGVGLIGFGTVGAGVADALIRNGELLASRLGSRVVLRGIADLDLETDRGVKVDRALLTRDAEALVRNPDIRIIVELVGGTGVARKFVLAAIEAGKTVVSANKALLAEHGAEIFGAARARGVDVYFGASVGGGIPIVRSLRDGLIGNRIESVHGILNGTCNYILHRMETEGLPFAAALQAAQAEGFAEADPSLDIDGVDTAHKAALLARLAYGLDVRLADLCIEGIRGLALDDIADVKALGYRIKLLAVVKREGDAVEVRVHPALVPEKHVLASVSGVFNAVMVRGDLVGDTLYYGRGAGRLPTASTVVADIADAVRSLASGTPRGWPVDPAGVALPRLLPIGEVVSRHYLRMSLIDKPGALARVAAALGGHGISIATALQRGETRTGEHVPVVILTQQAREAGLRAALAEIDAMDIVGAPTTRMRIEF